MAKEPINQHKEMAMGKPTPQSGSKEKPSTGFKKGGSAKKKG